MLKTLLAALLMTCMCFAAHADDKAKVWVFKSATINPNKAKLTLKDEVEGKQVLLERAATENSVSMHLALQGENNEVNRVFKFEFSSPPKEIIEDHVFEIAIKGLLESHKGECDTCDATCPLFAYAQGGSIKQAGTSTSVNFAENLCWLGTRKADHQKATQYSCSRVYRCLVETQKDFAGPFDFLTISMIPQIYAGPGMNYAWIAIEFRYELRKETP